MEHPDVVLIAPPTDLINMPSLGIGILKAGLENRKITCKAIYSNRMFIDAIGMDLHRDLFKGTQNNLISECLFAPFAHEEISAVLAKDLNGTEIPERLREYHRVLGAMNTDITDSLLGEGLYRCGKFIKALVEKIIGFNPKILGFSNSFMTTNAAIAIGKGVKRSLPEILYVVGGNNCQGTMGEELAESISSIDFVFQGDADEAFPDFCEKYMRDRSKLPRKLVKCGFTRDLDSLPIPEYKDFFEQQDERPSSAILSFEGSRGCWWGQKKRCYFCGEIEGDLHYRTKSPERMLRELFQMKATYPEATTFFATDAIFPDAYFRKVLPALVDAQFNRKLICETRANLSPEDIAVMKKCGMDRILVGIESLSTRLLKLINKGTDALTNIRLLRNCLEGGVSVSWLLMIGIPGDRTEDYETQLHLIPRIEHLMPPQIDPMRLQRFSPFFEEPERHGITMIQPLPAYRYVFPDGMDRDRLAYYFTAEYPSEARNDPDLMSRFLHGVRSWQDRWQSAPVPELSVRPIDRDTWEVKDTRTCSTAENRVLDLDEYSLLRKCRSGLPLNRIPSSSPVGRLLESGYLVKTDGRLLSLVCEFPSSDHQN